jgi:L,D-transpeptidase catalytic domain
MICINFSCHKKQINHQKNKSITHQIHVAQHPPIDLPNYQEITFHADSIGNKSELYLFDSMFTPNQKEIIAALNRLDVSRLTVGRNLVVPDTFYPLLLTYAPFPARLPMSDSIPQMILVSLRVQAFAMYESGKLIRWGPVSTGKQSTPTPAKLYYCNYKSKKKISTVSDEWIMPWYFNIENFDGIGLHQFTLPGYPASHTCIRMYEEDAKFNFQWSHQWQLSGDSIIKYGTPVIVYGTYHFDQQKPWRNLVEHPHDNRLSAIELQEIQSDISNIKQ